MISVGFIFVEVEARDAERERRDEERVCDERYDGPEREGAPGENADGFVGLQRAMRILI